MHLAKESPTQFVSCPGAVGEFDAQEPEIGGDTSTNTKQFLPLRGTTYTHHNARSDSLQLRLAGRARSDQYLNRHLGMGTETLPKPQQHKGRALPTISDNCRLMKSNYLGTRRLAPLTSVGPWV